MRYCLVRGLGVLLAAGILLGGGVVRASHYPLEAVPYVSDKDRAALAQQKITDTAELHQALLTAEARKLMSRKTGIAEEFLLEYARLCDLLRVRGIGPKMAKLLMTAGVQSIEDLRKETPATLMPKMKEANDSRSISEILPDEETLKDWIHQARKLDILLK